MKLYGQTYNTGWVDINGLVSFIDPQVPSPDAWPIPSPASPEEPNAALYPFWHDWVVDSKASVRTTVRAAHPTGSSSSSGATSTPTRTHSPG